MRSAPGKPSGIISAMIGDIDSLVLEQFRMLRAEQATTREDGREFRNRLANLESGQGTALQHMGHLASSIAQVQVSLDRIAARLDRNEQGLNLVDAS